jgi:hypothetical protein
MKVTDLGFVLFLLLFNKTMLSASKLIKLIGRIHICAVVLMFQMSNGQQSSNYATESRYQRGWRRRCSPAPVLQRERSSGFAGHVSSGEHVGLRPHVVFGARTVVALAAAQVICI